MNWKTTAVKETDNVVSHVAKPVTEVNAVPVKTARLTNKYYLYLCGVCGEQVSVTNNYCSHCGTKLNWVTGND